VISDLADAREAAAAEASARAELADRLEAVRAEASEARRELDNVRAVSGCAAPFCCPHLCATRIYQALGAWHAL
jgi:hypothetical protein